MSSFSELYSSYSAFEKPTFTFKLDGNALPQNREQVRIEELEVKLTCTEKAGSLRVTARLLLPGGADAQSWTGALKLGAKAELALGYDSTETDVFCGCLCEVRYLSGGGEEAETFRVELLCLDVKALMMSGGHFLFSGQKLAGTVIQEICGRAQYAAYLGTSSVTAPPEAWNLPLLLSRESDYEVLRELADFLGYEFYLFADTLYFTKPRTETTAVVQYAGINGILRLERSVRLTEQTGKVTVTGFDDGGERITFSKERSAETRTGAEKLSSVLSGVVKSYAETGVKTMEQAQYLAGVRMERSERQYGALECVSCGLPELRPGRFVQLSGLRAQFNGTYYLRDVVHTLDESGFTTAFTAEG